MMTPPFLKKYVRDPLLRAAERIQLSDNSLLMLLAVVVGVSCGLGAVGVRLLIDGVLAASVGAWGEGVLERLSGLPWVQLLFLPAAGGLVIGPLVYFLAREAKGHGVPEVMEAVALHGGRIRPRVVFVKSVASALCIGTGGSTGIEGPIIQIGSAIGSTLGQILRLRPDRMRVLVACGAAAGIAATFNAPLAGVLFSIEIILGSYAITVLMPVILSAVAGTAVSHAFPGITGGDVPAFRIPYEFKLISAWEFPLYLVLGLACALVALAFVKSLYTAEDLFDALPIPGWLKPALGGLAVGGMFVLLLPVTKEVYLFGSGYRSMELAMAGKIGWSILLGLVGLKIVATSLTLGSGGSGGIFAPSLFLGGMMGGAFGTGVHALFPAATAAPGAYAMVGMGAVVAGATHAPITAILILFEMTGDYQIILPLMIACIVANLVTSRLKRDSIYTEKLSRRGVNLNQGLETTIIGSARVDAVMETDAPTVMENETLNHVLQRFLEQHVMQVYVLDGEKRLAGIVHLNDVIALISEAGLGRAIIAADVMERKFPSARPDDALSDVFKKFGTCHLEEIPVVEADGRGPRRFLGVVTRRALFLFYNREVLRQSALGLKFVHRADGPSECDYVWMPADHEVKVVHVPPAMVGRTLKELDLRSRFNVNIVAIRGHRYDPSTDSDVPSPERVLRANETLVVVGGHDAIESMIHADDHGVRRA